MNFASGNFRFSGCWAYRVSAVVGKRSSIFVGHVEYFYSIDVNSKRGSRIYEMVNVSQVFRSVLEAL